ncbi:MAG: hypothetical protein K2X56_11500 [Mycobacterium pseudokansasii]|uniref:hypothetical protein n=1 Tax=Mycobacterium pseudokansasii TaxID=2341080 RepID=UPI0023F15811|nr:hypothetical protein [Mycobacterium pseudokansasii]MBY0388698.1 hypothetical protein [Mycobacterium pseudokansasii]
MSPPDDQPVPDVDRLAHSMLLLRGVHHDQGHTHQDGPGESRLTAPDFASDPERATAIREATLQDQNRYLTWGLQPVDCRFCNVTVNVRKLGPGYTAVQWNTEAWQRCAYFVEVRAAGGDTARTRSCPKLTDSIDHAVAEGCLDVMPAGPPPGDG